MSAAPSQPQFNFRKGSTLPPRASGAVTRAFDTINDQAAALWQFLRPHVMYVVGPAVEFINRPVLWKSRQVNPFRVDAAYYGRRDPRFWHGMSWSAFLQVFLIAWFTWGCGMLGCDEYLMPAGGGANALMAKQMMKVQKVKKVKKQKFTVNPNSPIKFDVPDIEKMMEEKITKVLEQGTAHTYAKGALGSGQGEGAGYSAGNSMGLVRFIRLKYEGGDWDSNYGKGADNNMLLEYKVRSGQKTANETEHRTIAQLNDFKAFRAPPFVYMTGGGGINVSDREVTTLRRYINDQHGMIFADAASPKFGGAFKNMMKRVLPEVKPVAIPIDDEIYKMPYILSSMPYASPHDPPMQLTGWKIKGRWVAIYHPGDIGDCWKDGHSGVSAEVADGAYSLGLNIIHYAHRTYNEWLMENNKKQ